VHNGHPKLSPRCKGRRKELEDASWKIVGLQIMAEGVRASVLTVCYLKKYTSSQPKHNEYTLAFHNKFTKLSTLTCVVRIQIFNNPRNQIGTWTQMRHWLLISNTNDLYEIMQRFKIKQTRTIVHIIPKNNIQLYVRC